MNWGCSCAAGSCCCSPGGGSIGPPAPYSTLPTCIIASNMEDRTRPSTCFGLKLVPTTDDSRSTPSPWMLPAPMSGATDDALTAASPVPRKETPSSNEPVSTDWSDCSSTPPPPRTVLGCLVDTKSINSNRLSVGYMLIISLTLVCFCLKLSTHITYRVHKHNFRNQPD